MNDDRERGNAPRDDKLGTPWGFFLVLAAIVVVAIVYSVSIIALSMAGSVTAETVFGAMAACFTVIGTLVGTYFGVKAGLDGQDKLKQTLARMDDSARERSWDDPEGSKDRKGKSRGSEDDRRRAREPQGAVEGARTERRDWDGGSV